MQLEDDEHVTSVIIIGNDGAERNLPSTAYRFDEAAGTLEVDPTSIRGDDLHLRVEITSDCRPIVQQRRAARSSAPRQPPPAGLS